MRYRCVMIVPCYNEAERLNTTAFARFIAENPEIRFIFVDDGSADGTDKVLETLCSGDSAEFLKLPRNQGKAEAVRQGMLKARKYECEYAGFWDADLATPLEELTRMLTFAGNGIFYLSGCRLLRLGGDIRRQWTRHVLGRVFATLVSMHLNLPIYDTQCGAKLYASQDVAELFTAPFATRWFFDVEIIKRLEAKHGRDKVLAQSIEIPLKQWHEVCGSKLRLLRTLADFCKLLFCTEVKK